MIVGGNEGDYMWTARPSKKTYFYNFLTNQWTPGPNLNTARADFACDVIKSETDTYVIATGDSKGILLPLQ